MRFMLLILPAALIACGEPVGAPNQAAEQNAAAPDALVSAARPVRVGELGPSFDACAGAGTTRRLDAGQALAVRAAPFETAEPAGSVSAGSRFFVCTRSLDQKWLGIVFAEDGTLAERCGVSAPLARRRDYGGPCLSGWVPSASVRLVSGVELPAQPSGARTTDPAPHGGNSAAGI
jgi:hypothetical protein